MLTPLVNIEVLNSGTNIKATDVTVYGDGTTDPTRAQSLVDFSIVFMRGTMTLASNSYDPEIVTQVIQPISSDGWYQIKMTITKNPSGTWVGDDYSYEVIKDVLVIDRLCACKANILAKITEKPCGCEDSGVLKDLYCIEGQLLGVSTLVAKNDMLSADMAVERLLIQCNEKLNSDCGC